MFDGFSLERLDVGDLRGARIESGHHMAEEAPEQLEAELRQFLAGAT